jgi:hypothetical protein
VLCPAVLLVKCRTEGSEVSLELSRHGTLKGLAVKHRLLSLPPRPWRELLLSSNGLWRMSCAAVCLCRRLSELNGTPWQAIDGKTLTTSAPGRGFQRICIRKLDGPRQHDLLDGINFYFQVMDLRGGRRRQAPKPSPRRFNSP